MITNKTSLKFLVVMVAVVCITMSMKTKEKAPAARIGVVSYAEIMRNLPEAVAAVAVLDTLYQQNQVQLREKMLALQAYAEQFNEKTPLLSDQEKEEWIARAEEMEQDVKDFKQNTQESMAQKQEELIKPLEQKVQLAIDALAKEKGYTHIFNSDGGGAPVFVYADTYTMLNEQILENLKTIKTSKL